MKVFVSYSHQDARYLSALEKHLVQIKRDGLIDVWHDREILGGSNFDSDIDRELESSGLFLAIVSPDFIESSYCYEVEMGRALERHRLGEMRVVPIVVEPCEWKRTPLKDLKALPKDGYPVSEWTNPNTAYLNIATELRRILEPNSGSIKAPADADFEPLQDKEPSLSRYRVKQTFDQIDRSDFNRRSFDHIRDYFFLSASELNDIDGIKCRVENYTETNFGGRIINSQLQNGGSAITVSMSNGSSGFGDIYYSGEEHAEPNTANGWFSIQATDFELLYSGSRMRKIFGQEEFTGTATDVARSLWSDFVSSAGIEYE